MSTTTGPPSALIFISTTIGLPPELSCGFSAGAPSKRREGHARNSNSLLPPGNRPEIRARAHRPRVASSRSEEHTSELQSHLNLVCRLLLEKKKNTELLNREV